ncbi:MULTISPECIES: ribonuclease R [unclassified Candidatus Frackibacter]|uniref:ribonuclease R n=1 Tax=unclassified Candidatus Frackibacter TaxID=2648818 RepID=UPI000883F64E|nr:MULTISPECIES: ribonuclease R [unclassified Candidatus Frackibacter]SDC70088.1 RNAse R [Candidatus Frackibacter sp. WG11]SEM85386.1 RNAse R [Candidatus Frackibacter sp. WG12]SFL94571.1 RNAse R [Candidatus Frackibacter sp. WG13]
MSAKQMILNFMRNEAYKPLTAEELLAAFEIPKEEQDRFIDIIERMEENGEIVKTRRGRYGVPDRMNLVVGRLERHSKGFGFLIPDDIEKEDVYISASDMNGAMNNDHIIVRIKGTKSGKKLSGEVIRILDRHNKTIVGSFESSRNFGFVVPDDSHIYYDIFVPQKEINGARQNQKVVVEITRWPEERRNPEGKIIEILGDLGEPGVDIEAIIRKLELPKDFPEEVKEYVRDIPETIPENESERRKDLRNLKMVTIDGEDAKDFDDAVSIEKLDGDKVRLGVHIADVSYYVKENTVLDEEARTRATSIYLVDRVIPMLPEKLSNNLCSLRSGEDRLAMTVLMTYDLESGDLLDHEILESIINVNHRLTYNKVREILVNEDEDLIAEYNDFIDELRLMEELCKELREGRVEEGSIDFDFPESRVILNEDGKPIDIIKVERSIAEKLIEEFMIATNRVVAEEIYWREVPFIYRVHDYPDQSDLEALNEFIHNFGYHIKGISDETHPKALQTVLKKVKGEAEERIINTVLLRSMKQAHYAVKNIGHFGLAAEYYSHFTSPIRRYPDLAIHRITKRVINQGVLGEEQSKRLEDDLSKAANHASIRERKAADAEMESKDLKKVEYMQGKEGEVYEGIISGMMSFGFFVELPNSVEGLVHVSNLTDDYYTYHEDKQSYIGERTGNIYRLGDEVKVEVYKVNLVERQVDLVLAE